MKNRNFFTAAVAQVAQVAEAAAVKAVKIAGKAAKTATAVAATVLVAATLFSCNPPKTQPEPTFGPPLEAEFYPEHLAGIWQMTFYREWYLEDGVLDEYSEPIDPEESMFYIFNADGTDTDGRSMAWTRSGRTLRVTFDGRIGGQQVEDPYVLEFSIDKLTATELKLSRRESDGEDRYCEQLTFKKHSKGTGDTSLIDNTTWTPTHLLAKLMINGEEDPEERVDEAITPEDGFPIFSFGADGTGRAEIRYDGDTDFAPLLWNYSDGNLSLSVFDEQQIFKVEELTATQAVISLTETEVEGPNDEFTYVSYMQITYSISRE